MFNFSDLDVSTRVLGYPSLTEKKRMRVDVNFDLKYDLPKDFYIKAGISLNYDNQPVENASALDYVLQTGLGWEW